MNLEVCVNKILQDLNLISPLTKHNIYPWQCARSQYRNKKESVRPIFWSNRTESYVHRTSHWDEFPNGRWGDNRSPAYGEFPNHHLLNIDINTNLNKRRIMYGKELHSIHSICKVFVNYLCNSNEVNQLPWCSQSIHSETIKYLLQPLKILNSHGFLTINSQPQINGIRSCESIIGWGRKDGIIYQKAYLEFFCNAEQLQILLRFIDEKHKSLTYQAVNHQNLLKSNCSLSNVNAVTWGVFPCCEIIQPTIVDPISFLSWKDEAFSLWQSDWQNIYCEDGIGHGLIAKIVDEWFLVNIVENNYLNGNIFQPFVDYFQFIHENKMDVDIGGVFEMSDEELQSVTGALVQNNGGGVSDLDDVKDDDDSCLGDDGVDDGNNPYLDENLLMSVEETKHILDFVDGKIN